MNEDQRFDRRIEIVDDLTDLTRLISDGSIDLEDVPARLASIVERCTDVDF